MGSAVVCGIVVVVGGGGGGGGAIVVLGSVSLVSVCLRVRGAHLVPDGIVLVLLGIVLVKVDHIDDSLGMLLLFFLGDAILLQHALPFFGEALCAVLASEGFEGWGWGWAKVE